MPAQIFPNHLVRGASFRLSNFLTFWKKQTEKYFCDRQYRCRKVHYFKQNSWNYKPQLKWLITTIQSLKEYFIADIRHRSKRIPKFQANRYSRIQRSIMQWRQIMGQFHSQNLGSFLKCEFWEWWCLFLRGIDYGLRPWKDRVSASNECVSVADAVRCS